MMVELEHGALCADDDPSPLARLLARAFVDYPVMCRAFARAPGDRADWIEKLGVQIVTARQLMGLPCLTATLHGSLVGLCLLSYSNVVTPPEIRQRFHSVLEEAGPEAVEFFERFLSQVNLVEVPEPHVWLAILAVDPVVQGKGVGRQLIERTVAIAGEMPDCRGVALDTENPKNVEIYRACGFEVFGEKRVDDMPVYVMWRPL